MITPTKADFETSDNHWQKLYLNGLAWSSAGLTSHRHKGITPFHVAQSTEERTQNPEIQVVYCLQADGEKHDRYFFEDEYQQGFSAFRELADNNKHPELYVAYTTNLNNDPEESFEAMENMPYNQRTNKKWMDHYKTWGII